MTLHEIEETVRTLASRHEKLDEATLVTLLRAGGWEDKEIADAKTIFASGIDSVLVASSHAIVSDQAHILPDPADIEHLLTAHSEVPEEKSEPIQKEPQSLITPAQDLPVDK